jgi:hypothetical protein
MEIAALRWRLGRPFFMSLTGRSPATAVMTGPVPVIHVWLAEPGRKAWMPGTSPGMTERGMAKDSRR